MKNLEDKLQIACVTWFKYTYPKIVIQHSKNGGSLKSAREGKKFKDMGVHPGFADLFIMKSQWQYVNDTSDDIQVNYHGLMIELKIGKNNQTDYQEAFEMYSKIHGYAYHVCRSIDEFMNVVNDYLK